MVSWGKAFGTALNIVLMSIVWYIIGIVIIAVGGVGVFLAALSNPDFLTNPSVYLRSLAVHLVAVIIGGAIIYLGGMATLLKYSAELVADEVEEVRGYSRSATPSPIQQAPPPTFKQDPIVVAAKSLGISTAGKTKEEVAKEIQGQTAKTKVCPKCGVRSTATGVYCDNCGERL